MNNCTFIGNLTSDVSVGSTGEGRTWANFRLAVDRYVGKDGNKVTDFIPVVAWDKNADNCAKYLKKGSKVAVQGRLEVGSYEKNGMKIATFKVNASQITFLTPSQKQEAEKPVASNNLTAADVSDDDMPF